jgi:hypothetical protein
VRARARARARAKIGSFQRATCDVRRATCDVRRATCDVRRATCVCGQGRVCVRGCVRGRWRGLDSGAPSGCAGCLFHPLCSALIGGCTWGRRRGDEPGTRLGCALSSGSGRAGCTRDGVAGVHPAWGTPVFRDRERAPRRYTARDVPWHSGIGRACPRVTGRARGRMHWCAQSKAGGNGSRACSRSSSSGRRAAAMRSSEMWFGAPRGS